VFTSFLDNISNRTWPNLRSGISLRVRIDSPQQQLWVDDCELVFVSESCWDVALIKIPETCVLNGFLPYLPLRTPEEMYVYPENLSLSQGMRLFSSRWCGLIPF
jgi:hypothetical protein